MEALVQLGIARCTASDGKPVFLPGVFDETWLPAFSGRIYRQLGEADCLHFARALRFYDNHIYWGSACSGAETPRFCFDGLIAALASEGLHVKTTHLYSAEIVDWKRRWIMSLHDIPRHVFDDMSKLSSIQAECSRTGRIVNCTKFVVALFVAGFSCKSASGLNTACQGAVPVLI